uniref:FLYWCH-type domain-containing protein n=1 Tax=Phlebotomus papatasi TaxID=29031 RepID=A0A1B0GN78_PHLPP
MHDLLMWLTQRGYRCLVINGHQFVKDRLSHDSINWRCGHFQKFKCKARAVTKVYNGVEMLKITQGTHSHTKPQRIRKHVAMKSWRPKKLPLFTYVVGQRGTPKILYEGFTYICTKSIKNRKYWVCSKQRSRGCRARIITDYDETELITRNNEILLPFNPKFPQTTHVLWHQKLEFVRGQRGHQLLVFDGYCFSKNNTSLNTTYWTCRYKSLTKGYCRARLMTTQTDEKNDLHRITVTKPHHNHEPTRRMQRKYKEDHYNTMHNIY